MLAFGSAPHHDILALLVQVTVLLLTARGLGELAQRFGQPSVAGEILAGIVLGPAGLSGLSPFLKEWLVPQTQLQGYLLEIVSMTGAMFLLLVTGLETDLALIRRHARTAIGVSLGGILVCFSSGFLLGQALPDALLAAPAERLVFALFVATAMSISAIPVIAKVLIDMNLMRRDIGQTIIAAGMNDDTTGWILLSIVAGLATGHSATLSSVLEAGGSVLAFMLFSFTVGRWLVKRVLDFVQDEVTSRDRLLTLMVALTFGWGALTQALRLEAVLGAFVMGILFGQMPRLPQEVRHTAESIALGVFAPIFFAVAGLKVHLGHLLTPPLIAIALVVIAVASVGKVLGTYLGARLIGGRDHWTALSFGAGLNARGAMEIIVATVGLSLGILTQEMFSIIVLMALATSLMAPPALRWVLRHVQPSEEELRRLRQEELAVGSRVAGIHRVLLPVRRREGGDSPTQRIEARILERMRAKNALSITLFTVADPDEEQASSEFLQRLSHHFPGAEVLTKVVAGEPAEAILDEAQKDYDLLVLGASEVKPGSEALFSSMVDFLIRSSPCLTLVVQGRGGLSDWAPRRILIPTDGTLAARHAGEVAFALATDTAAQVTVLHVVVPSNSISYQVSEDMAQRRLASGYRIVQDLRSVGDTLGVNVVADVAIGDDVANVIVEAARKSETDLLVLGTALRVGTDRFFLGARVEAILQHAPCPVVVVNAF